ncbi:hypothetical protein, partial [Campylobacter jejuni]
DKNLKLSSSENLSVFNMKKGENSTLKIGEKADAKDLRLYSLDNLNFVVKFASLHGAQEIQGVNRPQDESFWLWFKSAWLEFARTI